MRTKTCGQEEWFGLAVEVISGAMKGLALYSALVFFGFIQYQSKTAQFQPWYYFMIVPWMAVAAWLFRRLNGGIFALSQFGMLALWGVFAMFSKGMMIYMLAAGALGVAGSLIAKFWRADTDSRKHIRRFKAQNNLRFGFVICIFGVLSYIDTHPATVDYPIPVSVCAGYIIGAFGIYLVLCVMMRYMYMQYDYFRIRAGMDESIFRQLRRMNGIVAIVSAVVIGLAILLTGQTLARALAWLVERGLGYMIGAGLVGLSEIKLKQFTGGNAVIVDEGSGARRARSATDITWLKPLMAVILIVLFVYALWKVYKHIGANFAIGSDEAEFITKNGEKEFLVEGIGRESDGMKFGTSNREKIRKYFYRILNRRMKKKDVGHVRSKTSKELVQIYGKPTDRENMQKLADYYKKARYSGEDCTPEDAEQAKRLADDI